jgi:hypothetical protein
MVSTITPEQQKAIADLLQTMTLPAGLGTEQDACSIAAINLALTGELTDHIPDCMSPVTGRWIISVQDKMPDDLRNSAEWKSLLPLAAGTGRNHEGERLQTILKWIWETALPLVLPVADSHGFGAEWRTMLRNRTTEAADAADAAAWAAARAAARAADAAGGAAWAAARAAAWAADAAGAAAWAAARAAAWAAAGAADAADAAARAADAAARAAARAADAAARAAAGAADAAWRQLDPCGLLMELINVTSPPEP